MEEVRIADLTGDEIPSLVWSGAPTHLRYIADALRRAGLGEVNFLVVWVEGTPVGIGGIDFSYRDDTGKLWMLAVKESHQGRGVGTTLILALEERARRHDRISTELSVEMQNTRAKALYERLGYKVIGRTTESWEQEMPGGIVTTYVADCFVMRKAL